MSDTEPGAALPEEPQDERGAPGSRDKGHPPAGGPADRPAGKAEGADEDSSVDPQGPIQEDMPNWPTGDQGG